MGIFASTRIPPGTVIPVMCPTATEEEYTAMHPCPSALLECDRYAYEFLTRVYNKDTNERAVLIASLKEGCEIQYINDARGSGFPVNVEFCEVVYRGWPHLFIVTLRAIEVDEEVLIDYGNRYWDARDLDSLQAVREELLEALGKLGSPPDVLQALRAHIAPSSPASSPQLL
eukprot:Tamp_22185.p1 GENE.Tamp_22185~~Tamp_22185.p1  ORF type:complete len:172 (-),score=16.88 Tamp_22185:53-568(-)